MPVIRHPSRERAVLVLCVPFSLLMPSVLTIDYYFDI